MLTAAQPLKSHGDATGVPEYALPNPDDPAYAAYAEIFQKFQPTEVEEEEEKVVSEHGTTGSDFGVNVKLTHTRCYQDEGPQKAEVIYSDEEDDDEEERDQARAAHEQMSKKKMKKMSVS
jgi:hypothetical protein